LLKRRRPLPEAQSTDEYEAARAGRQALNTPMQGSSADIVTLSMLVTNTEPLPELKEKGWFHPRLHEMGVKYLLQIHDENLYEVPEEHAEEACQIIKDCMESPKIKLKIPLKVEANIAPNWGEGK
jgi:DNA polymerase I